MAIMFETVFRPKYSLSGSFDVLSLSLLMAIVLLFSYIRFGIDLSTILGSLLLLFFTTNFSQLYIRRIIFTHSYFIVEKYVWPSRKIAYFDVIDLGFSKVKTRRGDISFASMSNAAQLHSLFSELIQQGRIDGNLFENKVIVEELALKKAILPTMAISIVLNGVFLFYWYYNQLRFSTLSFWLVIILIILVGTVTMLAIYWINKKRIKLQ
jgi:hypothetical protein